MLYKSYNLYHISHIICQNFGKRPKPFSLKSFNITQSGNAAKKTTSDEEIHLERKGRDPRCHAPSLQSNRTHQSMEPLTRINFEFILEY